MMEYRRYVMDTDFVDDHIPPVGHYWVRFGGNDWDICHIYNDYAVTFRNPHTGDSYSESIKDALKDGTVFYGPIPIPELK